MAAGKAEEEAKTGNAVRQAVGQSWTSPGAAISGASELEIDPGVTGGEETRRSWSRRRSLSQPMAVFSAPLVGALGDQGGGRAVFDRRVSQRATATRPEMPRRRSLEYVLGLDEYRNPKSPPLARDKHRELRATLLLPAFEQRRREKEQMLALAVDAKEQRRREKELLDLAVPAECRRKWSLGDLAEENRNLMIHDTDLESAHQIALEEVHSPRRLAARRSSRVGFLLEEAARLEAGQGDGDDDGELQSPKPPTEALLATGVDGRHQKAVDDDDHHHHHHDDHHDDAPERRASGGNSKRVMIQVADAPCLPLSRRASDEAADVESQPTARYDDDTKKGDSSPFSSSTWRKRSSSSSASSSSSSSGQPFLFFFGVKRHSSGPHHHKKKRRSPVSSFASTASHKLRAHLPSQRPTLSGFVAGIHKTLRRKPRVWRPSSFLLKADNMYFVLPCAFIFTACSGFINATTMLGALSHDGVRPVTVTHISGTVTRLGVSVLHREHSSVTAYVGALVGFLAGAVAAGAVTPTGQFDGTDPRKLALYGLALLLVAALLGTAVLVQRTASFAGSVAAVVAAAAACGAQNGLFTTVTAAAVRTTHVSGITTDIGLILGRTVARCLKKKHLDKALPPVECRRLFLLSLIFLGFSTGAICAGALADHLAGKRFEEALAIPASFQAALALLAIAIAARHPRAPRTLASLCVCLRPHQQKPLPQAAAAAADKTLASSYTSPDVLDVDDDESGFVSLAVVDDDDADDLVSNADTDDEEDV